MGFLSCSIEVLLGFISFHWDFPGLTGWWVGFTGFYWVLLGLTITRVSMAKAGHARGANGARIRSRCLEIVGQVERKCDGDWIRWRERSFVPSESLEPAGFYRVLRSFCARACVSVCVWVCVCVCVCVCCFSRWIICPKKMSGDGRSSSISSSIGYKLDDTIIARGHFRGLPFHSVSFNSIRANRNVINEKEQYFWFSGLVLFIAGLILGFTGFYWVLLGFNRYNWI